MNSAKPFIIPSTPSSPTSSTVTTPTSSPTGSSSLSSSSSSSSSSTTTATRSIHKPPPKQSLPYAVVVLNRVLWLALIGCMIYHQQNVNWFLLWYQIVHIVVTPIVSLRENDTIHLRSVEYNTETLLLVGLVSYAVALSFLSYYDTVIVIGSTDNTNELPFLFNKSKEYYAIGIIAGYEFFASIFSKWYCQPYLLPKNKSTIVVEATMKPIYLLLMVFFLVVNNNNNQNNDENNDNDVENKTTTSLSSSSSLVGLYCIYKMIRFTVDYKKVTSLRTETVPQKTLITMSLDNTIHEKKQQPDDDDGKTSSTTNHCNANTANAATSYRSSNQKKNTTKSDYIWNIYGCTYDLSDYIQYHPGGKEAILLGANRDDSTALFQSYHAFTIGKAKSVLEKYRVHTNNNNNNNNNTSTNQNFTTPPDHQPDEQEKHPTKSLLLTSSRHENDLFYDELCIRIKNQLQDLYNLNIIQHRGATYKRYTFYLLLIVLTMITGYAHFKGSIIGSILFAICGGYSSGHIGHDGGHHSVSRKPYINDIAVWFISWIDNPIVWQHQHTFAHHCYTNQYHHDPDLHHFHTLLRVTKLTPLLRRYKKQASAMYILYSFLYTSIGQCYWYPWRVTLERSLHGAVGWTDHNRLIRVVGLFTHLIGYFTIVFVIPFFVHTSSWKAFLAGLLHVLTSGFIFALVSQVGHITHHALQRDRTIAKTKRHPIAQNSWAAEQIESSNNYGNNSLFVYIFSAGLCLQIEHHLFPHINHCHLHLIQPIVEQACKEYNVRYNKYPTWISVMKDTIHYLQTLAKDDIDDIIVDKKND